jgi:hypothetical protein
MTRRLAALALALVLGTAACGSSRQEREVDRLADECRALVPAGATVRDADRTFGSGANFVGGPFCNPLLAPAGGNDTCPASSAENPQCQRFYYWLPTDPGLCEPGGCWVVCEARVMRQDAAWGGTGTFLDAKICASRFLRGQPPP